MLYEDRIRNERAHMSKSFAKLADFLLDSYVQAAFMTASELAQTLNLDAATVVRFSQFLGYKGFPDMQEEIRGRVQTDLLIHPERAKDKDSAAGIAAEAMQEILTSLEKTRISFDTQSLEKLVELIGEVRRVVILAEGPAQPTAYNLVHFLEQGGFPVYIARSGVSDLARTINNSTTNDLLLAMEIAGRTPYIARALADAQSKGIQTAAIIGSASLASGRSADVVLSAMAHESLGIGIVAVEAIVYTLAQILRWRYAERFAGTEQAISELSSVIQNPSD